MNIHKNARLTPLRREEMAVAVISGQLSQAQAARVSSSTSKLRSLSGFIDSLSPRTLRHCMGMLGGTLEDLSRRGLSTGANLRN